MPWPVRGQSARTCRLFIAKLATGVNFGPDSGSTDRKRGRFGEEQIVKILRWQEADIMFAAMLLGAG